MLTNNILFNGEVACTVMNVTPDLAHDWLSHHNTRNRSISQTRVEQIVHDIESGRFVNTGDTIRFFKDGTLADGQHRLTAVVRTQRPMKMFVIRNVPEEGSVVIDGGKPRTASDMAKISGRNYGNDHVAVANAMSNYRIGRSKSNQHLIEFVDRHRDAVFFSVDSLKNRPCNNAVVRSVVARAYYHLPQAVLTRFCEVLTTGVTTGVEESAAVAARDYSLKSREATSAIPMRLVAARRYESALSAFIDGRPLTILRESKVDLYPLVENV